MMTEELCCNVCYENYMDNGIHEPRVMHCGHSICFSCLDSLYLSQLPKLCPFCKSHLFCALPEQFPKNYELIQVITRRNEIQSEISSSNQPKPDILSSNRLTLAQLQYEYNQTILQQHRNELIEYDRIKTLALNQVIEIERLSRDAKRRFFETKEKLDESISILRMLSTNPKFNQNSNSFPALACDDNQPLPLELESSRTNSRVIVVRCPLTATPAITITRTTIPSSPDQPIPSPQSVTIVISRSPYVSPTIPSSSHSSPNLHQFPSPSHYPHPLPLPPPHSDSPPSFSHHHPPPHQTQRYYYPPYESHHHPFAHPSAPPPHHHHHRSRGRDVYIPQH